MRLANGELTLEQLQAYTKWIANACKSVRLYEYEFDDTILDFTKEAVLSPALVS